MTYDYRRYNRYDQLRPHWGFWLVMLFLSRHVIAFVLIAMSAGGMGGRGGGTGRDAIDLGGVMALVEPIHMIADVPALVLLYALGSRLPKAGAAVRGIWRAGRWLIAASAALYLGLSAWTGAGSGWLAWLMAALNGAVVGYALGSGYMKDLFAQFPPRDADSGS